jgi:hypothetical protein
MYETTCGTRIASSVLWQSHVFYSMIESAGELICGEQCLPGREGRQEADISIQHFLLFLILAVSLSPISP